MTCYREDADDYAFVIAQDGKNRVIACSDAIQWIVQVHYGKRWRSRLYFRRSEYLRRAFNPALGSAARAIIDRLPEMFPETDYPETALQLSRNRGGEPKSDSGLKGSREAGKPI
jgi:hypothetical protein